MSRLFCCLLLGLRLMILTPQEHTIRELIAPSVHSLGFGIVQVKLLERTKQRTLQILAERQDGKPITVNDCTDISRQVSTVLDVEDPIQGAYHLEVSSPGLDRPLTCEADFVRFTGQDVKIELSVPLEGRKRFQGALKETTQGNVNLVAEDGAAHTFSLENIRSAKLVVTDAMIKALMKKENTNV